MKRTGIHKIKRFKLVVLGKNKAFYQYIVYISIVNKLVNSLYTSWII